MANNFTRGQTFADGQANGVTADKLHALVEGADITASFTTGRTEKTTPATDDFILLYDGATGTYKKVNYSNLTASPSVIAGYRKLKVTNNSGSPLTTIDITADDAVLKNGSGAPKYHSSVSLSCNITVSGANGLDTGTENSSTWYYLWLISDGTTVASLLSTSATSPTLPGQYSYKVLVGGVYNTSGGDFWKFVQQDNRYSMARQISTGITIGQNATVTSSTNYTAISVQTSGFFVPPHAVRIWGTVGRASTTSVNFVVSGDNNGDAIGAQVVPSGNGASVMDGFGSGGAFSLVLKDAQQFYCKTATASVTDGRIVISGFEIPR